MRDLPHYGEEIPVPTGLRGVAVAYRIVRDIPNVASAGDIVCCPPPASYSCALIIKYIIKG